MLLHLSSLVELMRFGRLRSLGHVARVKLEFLWNIFVYCLTLEQILSCSDRVCCSLSVMRNPWRVFESSHAVHFLQRL